MTQYPQYNNDSVNSNSDSECDDYDNLSDIEEDEQYGEVPIVNGRTYIGLPIYEPTNGILFGCQVSAQSFHKYNLETVCEFLKDWSCSQYVSSEGTPEIMKLSQTENNSGFAIYSVLLKTTWLRIVQRRWKTIMRCRRQIIFGRISARNRRHNELTGRHLPEFSVLPGIRGCLADIK